MQGQILIGPEALLDIYSEASSLNNLASTTTNHLQQVFQLGHRWFEVHFHILAAFVSRRGKKMPCHPMIPTASSLSLSQNPVQNILQAKAHPKQLEF